MTSPAARGYRMPAEWVPHQATWLVWPQNPEDWPGKLELIGWVYGEIVRKLSPHERVNLIVEDAARAATAGKLLEQAGAAMGNVSFHVIRTDRGWIRDSGPIFLARPGAPRIAVDFRFNAWAKYDNWHHDDVVAGKVAELAGVERLDAIVGGDRLVLEGGAIDVDGEGTLLATEECLLSDVQARNPRLDREGTEAALRDWLGVTTIVWLGNGIAGDDTHGHIDDLARFVAPGRVVLCAEPDARDANHRALAENRERLQGARDAGGRRLEVIDLPMPAPLVFDGVRLPASYANFYVANDIVIVPTFNDPADRVALGILGECFPSRTVVGIHAVDLVWGLGTLHCMTQQEPLP